MKDIKMTPRIALVSLYDHHAFNIRNTHSILTKNNIETYCIFYKYFKFKMEPSSSKELNILIRLLKDLSIDIIGISVFSTFFREAVKLTNRLKADLDIPVFWEGFHATIKPEDCIEFADFVFIGEPGENLLQFINNWDKINTINIPGLWARKGKEIIKESTPQFIEDLSNLPMLDFDDVNKYYIEENQLFCGDPIYNPENFSQLYECRYHILSSRGCPFDCSYCCNPVLKNLYNKCGKLYIRRRSVNSVIAELRYAKEHLGAKSIIFADSCFATDLKWVSDFCKSYKDKIHLPFYCETHPEIINEELISILCNAGLRDTCIGIQSGSERIRYKYMDRHTSDKLIFNKTELLKKYNVGIHYEIITDNPYEKEEDKYKTLKLLLKLPRPLCLNVFSLNFFPETKITKQALVDRLISEEDVEGASTRGMQQFILKKPRDAKDIFWNYIYFLASDLYCSSGNIPGLRHIFSNNFILFLSNLRLIKKFPWVFVKSVDILNELVLIKRALSKWQKLHTVYFPEKPILFLRILIFSCLAYILINFIGAKKLLSVLNSDKKRTANNKKINKIIKYVNFVMNLEPWRILKNHCLIRSTILYYFLRREGLKVKINFGIKKENGILKGHSWLILNNGEVYLEEGQTWKDFELIYSFPS